MKHTKKSEQEKLEKKIAKVMKLLDELCSNPKDMKLINKLIKKHKA